MAGAAVAFGVLAVYRLVSAINDPIKRLQKRTGPGPRRQPQRLGPHLRRQRSRPPAGRVQQMVARPARTEPAAQPVRPLRRRDVARRAIETGTELGGEDRYVGVLFVDIVGSTRLAVHHAPRESSDAQRVLPRRRRRRRPVPRRIRQTSSRATRRSPSLAHRWNWTTSPGAHWPPPAGCASNSNLPWVTPTSASVSRPARAIAEPHQFEQRLGTPSSATRSAKRRLMTDLAKDEPARVLGSARAVFLGDDDEAHHWEIGEGVELRGRGIETLLARPVSGRSPTRCPTSTGTISTSPPKPTPKPSSRLPSSRLPSWPVPS